MSIYKKTLLCITLFVLTIVSAIVCIGIFYGNTTEVIWGPYICVDIMPKTIYRINDDIYVPLTVDNETGRVADDIPYYIGCISEDIKGINFNQAQDSGISVGKITDDFLGTKYYDYNSDVCSVDVLGEIHEDVLIMKNGTYIGKLEKLYSKNMKKDWFAYAEELDIIFDTMLYKQAGEHYFSIDSNFKKSGFYQEESGYINWHKFKKQLNFFVSDVKSLI